MGRADVADVADAADAADVADVADAKDVDSLGLPGRHRPERPAGAVVDQFGNMSADKHYFDNDLSSLLRNTIALL